MKKIYPITIMLFALYTNSNSQVNYSFSATTATYSPVSGGTTPTLSARPWDYGQTSLTYDEGFANNLPIGFTFTYNGIDYTAINICANGFATLGTPFREDVTIVEKFYINSLKLGPIFNYAGRDTAPEPNTKPVLAPLWDDLNMQADANLRYITTGSPGSRVFTFEWSNALWQFDATANTISFELKLYEGTNVVEFCYKDEGGIPNNPSASIGITGSNDLPGGFISLQNTSASPTVTRITETNNLYKKPATDQVYRFTPLACKLPLTLHYDSYNNNSATFSWTAPAGISNFEYALNTSEAPASGTATTATTSTVSSLLPGTKYYIHVRSYCSAASQSAWSTIPFTTTKNIVSPPGIECQSSFGGSMNDYMDYPATSIKQTSDGGYIVLGTSNSGDGDVTGNHGNSDYWVVKFSNLCTIQWQRSLGGTGYEEAHSIEQTSDGGYIIAGLSSSNDGDVSGNHNLGDGLDAWIVKLSIIGDIQWQKCLGGSSLDWAFSIKQTTDEGYIIAGKTQSNDGDVSGLHEPTLFFYDYWIVKLNNIGTIEWQKCLGGDDEDEAHSIQQTSDGGYIVAGQSVSSNGDITDSYGNWDAWIAKLDNSGTIQWQKKLGGSGYDAANSIVQTSDGGYIVAGNSASADGDVTDPHDGWRGDYWIVKLNSSGGILWKKCLGGTGSDDATSIKQTSDGGYIVAGSTDSNDDEVSGNHGLNDYWIVKLSSSGEFQWQKSFGGSAADNASSIDVTTDGGYIVAGTSYSNDGDVTGNHGNGDYWVVKLAPDVLLPISLLDFSGEVKDKQNLLHWTTANELNNTGFEVQRSTDGNNFNKISFTKTKAINGSSNANLHYDFIDINYSSAINYYRLKLIDKEGKFSYSNIVVLRNNNIPASGLSVIYPSPARNILNVKIASQSNNKITLLITDLSGRLLQKRITQVSNGETILQLDVEGLPAGTYFLKLLSSDTKQNAMKKFVKE